MYYAFRFFAGALIGICDSSWPLYGSWHNVIYYCARNSFHASMVGTFANIKYVSHGPDAICVPCIKQKFALNIKWNHCWLERSFNEMIGL